MSELTNSTPVIEAPQVDDPWSEPLSELKQRAGIDQPSQPAPLAQLQPQSQPPNATEPFSVAQDGSGITIQMSPEFGGEVFKGKDWAEVGPKIAKAKADANAYIKQLKGQPAQPSTMPQPLLDPAMQQSPEEVQKEAAQFLRKLVLTPEVRQQIVAEAVGVDPHLLPQTVQGITSTVREFQNNNELINFHAKCPDYLDTPENAAALGETLFSLVGDVPGYQLSADDLEIAYAVGLRRGTIKPHVPQTQPIQISRPPVMPSAGAPSLGGDQNAWSMDLGDLKKAAGLG